MPSGKIEILCKKEEKTLVLSVSDNGKGLPDNFDIHVSQSLGFKLIKAFSDKLQSELIILGTNGTRIEMRIKNYKAI